MLSEISEGIFLCMWGRGLFRRYPVGPGVFPGALPVCAAERSVEVCIIFEAAQQISLVRHGSPSQQITYRVEPLLHQVTINARAGLLAELVHQVIFADKELLCQLVYGQRPRVMLVDADRTNQMHPLGTTPLSASPPSRFTLLSEDRTKPYIWQDPLVVLQSFHSASC